MSVPTTPYNTRRCLFFSLLIMVCWSAPLLSHCVMTVPAGAQMNIGSGFSPTQFLTYFDPNSPTSIKRQLINADLVGKKMSIFRYVLHLNGNGDVIQTVYYFSDCVLSVNCQLPASWPPIIWKSNPFYLFAGCQCAPTFYVKHVRFMPETRHYPIGIPIHEMLDMIRPYYTGHRKMPLPFSFPYRTLQPHAGAAAPAPYVPPPDVAPAAPAAPAAPVDDSSTDIDDMSDDDDEVIEIAPPPYDEEPVPPDYEPDYFTLRRHPLAPP